MEYYETEHIDVRRKADGPHRWHVVVRPKGPFSLFSPNIVVRPVERFTGDERYDSRNIAVVSHLSATEIEHLKLEIGHMSPQEPEEIVSAIHDFAEDIRKNPRHDPDVPEPFRGRRWPWSRKPPAES